MGMLKLNCEYCGKIFFRDIAHAIRRDHNFCCHKCSTEFSRSAQELTCPVCNREFKRLLNQIKKSKSGISFCSRSCAATYNNQHKTTGTRVSKLELWLQEKLTEFYPNLEILFNQKDTIESELDIYIPSLKLAFELNGIFHYEPIFGDKKFGQIQNNDQRKFAACSEHNISLCIIDVSKQVYFIEKTSMQFLDIIKNIIEQNLQQIQ